VNGVLFSQAARDDLIEIWDYIAKDNLDAADRVVAKIKKEISFLAKSPGIGHKRRDLTRKDVRFWNIYSYLVVYQETSPMHIVRILHGFRDIADLL